MMWSLGVRSCLKSSCTCRWKVRKGCLFRDPSWRSQSVQRAWRWETRFFSPRWFPRCQQHWKGAKNKGESFVFAWTMVWVSKGRRGKGIGNKWRKCGSERRRWGTNPYNIREGEWRRLSRERRYLFRVNLSFVSKCHSGHAYRAQGSPSWARVDLNVYLNSTENVILYWHTHKPGAQEFFGEKASFSVWSWIRLKGAVCTCWHNHRP